MISRRSFFAGMGSSLIAAPAIVRVASLMPVRSLSFDAINRLDILYGFSYPRREWVGPFVSDFDFYQGEQWPSIIAAV